MSSKIKKFVSPEKLARQHLKILKKLQKSSGLFLASGEDVKTGYDKAWLRDNFYECLAFEYIEDWETVKKTYRAILDIFKKHQKKIDYAIAQKPEYTYQYINARYNPETFDEFWEEWGNKQNDAIVLSGKTAEVSGRILELYLNRNQDQFGVELELRSARLWNLLDGFLNFTAMSNRAEVAGAMERNRQIPQYIGNAGFYFQRRQFDFAGFAKYTSAFENTRFAAPDATDIVRPQPLGDFVTFDLNAGWSFGNTRVYFEAQNLTDEKFSTVVGYPDFGRRLTLGIRRVL